MRAPAPCDIDEAVRRVLDGLRPSPPVDVPPAEAAGLVLAEDVLADRDQPPIDLSAMDGYAVRAVDTAAAGGTLDVVSTTAAGARPADPLPARGAARVMTGAPLPPDADAVLRFERVEELAGGRIRTVPVQPGEDVRRAGTERRLGETLIPRGRFLGPAELAVAVGVGRRSLRVHARPRVAVAATGDELVAGEPRPWQVRNSNGPLLEALVRQCGGHVMPLGVLRDRDDELDRGLQRARQEAQIIVLSGGVSRGDRDLVPGAFSRAAFRTLVHGVRVKPGKPVLAAAPAAHAGGRTMRAFGLPGHPVSALVAFLLFVWPALRRLAGRRSAVPLRVRARLAAPTEARSSRTELRAVRLEARPDGWRAHAVLPHASADLAAAAGAAGFAVLAGGPRLLEADEKVEVVALPDILERVLTEGDGHPGD